jgi:hypothetical protein
MTARVTATEVKAILKETELTDPNVEEFIAAATLVVDSVFSGDTTTSASLLKEIERWFTAHLIACTLERMEKEAGAGTAYIKYIGDYGQGLSGTPYGQAIMTMDITGKMAMLYRRAASTRAVTSFS